MQSKLDDSWKGERQEVEEEEEEELQFASFCGAGSTVIQECNVISFSGSRESVVLSAGQGENNSVIFLHVQLRGALSSLQISGDAFLLLMICA